MPRLVGCLVSGGDDLSVMMDGREMSGEQYRYALVKKLCDLDWTTGTCVALMPIIQYDDYDHLIVWKIF